MTASGLRVLQVITTATRRGAERFAVDLDEALGSLGFEVSTVALGPGVTPTLPVEILGEAPLSPANLWRLRRLIGVADVVVAHGSKSLPASVLASVGSSVPIVYLSIGDPYHWSRPLHRRLRTAALLARTSTVVSLTEEGGRRVVERYRVPRQKVTSIPNGVRAESYPLRTPAARAEARRALGIGDDDRLLAYVGALSPEKAPLDAVATLARLPSGWRLIMAGEGGERGRIEASTEFAAGRVTLLGQVEDPQPVMAAADAMVLSSRTEGVPGVLIEAAMVGLPVVATDVGFVAEVVEDGVTGFVVPAGDSAALADAVRRCSARSDEIGLAAHRRAVATHAMEPVAAKWANCLKALVASRPPALGGRRSVRRQGRPGSAA